jgi:3-methyladenine DNA glycosylase AlkC
MPEAFKTLINAPLVRATAHELHRVWPGFDRSAFEHRALAGLDRLEMKARAMQIADALEAVLPADFDRAAGVIEAALAPPDEGHGKRVGSLEITAAGLAGWVVWPLGEFVARRGLAEPDRALECLRQLTQRFSAEFAIRPFIANCPAQVWPVLARWVHDPNTHVRRLVSEGSRPRLPWGLQLAALIADPTPTRPLLEALQDDPTAYVRRSVANHLNDIARDHPGLIVDWVSRHLPQATPERAALLRHASRGLIKQGHRQMLGLWDATGGFQGEAVLTVSPRSLRIGESVTLEVRLRSSESRRQSLVVDLVLRSPAALGGTNSKVFKGWSIELDDHARMTLTRRLPMRPVTTRRVAPGHYAIGLRINGEDQPAESFELRAAAA